MDFLTPLKENKFHIFEWNQKYSAPHTHNFLELVYVLEGECIHILNGNRIKIKKGNYFVVDYFSSHAYMPGSEDVKIINCLFLPEFIDPSLIHCSSFEEVVSSYQIHFSQEFFTANPSFSVYNDDGHILKLMKEILNEYNKKDAGYLQIIRAKMIEVLVTTMRTIYNAPVSKQGSGNLQKIILFINKNYMNSITLNEICKNFGYSVPYISASFKKEYGISFKDYLQKIRIEQSLRLLAHTKKSISEIAEEVGYNDLKSFHQIFKRQTGTTPLKFRKSFL